MAYVDKINAGGELRDIHDTAGRQMIAPIELTSTATAAHAKGEYFIYNDTLYETTSAIAVGGTITPNTNCTAVPDGVSNEFGGEISQLKSAIQDLEAGSLSAVGATAGQVPVADGNGSWAWGNVSGGGVNLTSVQTYVADYTNEPPTPTLGSVDKYYRRIYGT